jgi:hypothetical protein
MWKSQGSPGGSLTQHLFKTYASTVGMPDRECNGRGGCGVSCAPFT